MPKSISKKILLVAVACIVSYFSKFLAYFQLVKPVCCDAFSYIGWPVSFIQGGGFTGATEFSYLLFLLNTLVWVIILVSMTIAIQYIKKHK